MARYSFFIRYMNNKLLKHLYVQNIALKVLREIQSFITAGKTEKDIADECKKLLLQSGINQTWYHGIFALVQVGSNSTLSISGRNYIPSNLEVCDGDIVTIDLSPSLDGYWGDCARSYGVNNIHLEEGIFIEKELHRIFQSIISPQMTMHDAYVQMNAEIINMGYENLDFQQNLGHSIEKKLEDRLYIEQGNNETFENIIAFTFEPHIRKIGGKDGFKYENIYYFENNKALPLGDTNLL